MRCLASILCFCLAFAMTAVAQAALTVQSATLNGGATVTVAPSASITADVTTVVSGPTNWRGTEWNISGTNCVDTTDHNSAGTFSESFSITAPSAAGTYSVTFTAHSNNACGGTASSGYTLTNSIVVCTTPTAPTSANVDHA